MGKPLPGCFAAVAVALMAAGCGGGGAQTVVSVAPAFLIAPGQQRIGPVAMGEPCPTVDASLGSPPITGQTGSTGRIGPAVVRTDKALGLAYVCAVVGGAGAPAVVVGIVASGEGFSTTDGVRVGAPTDTLTAAGWSCPGPALRCVLGSGGSPTLTAHLIDGKVATVEMASRDVARLRALAARFQ